MKDKTATRRKTSGGWLCVLVPTDKTMAVFPGRKLWRYNFTRQASGGCRGDAVSVATDQEILSHSAFGIDFIG